jgi:hypothetical protein
LRSSEGDTVGKIELRVNSMFFEGPKCKNDDDVRPAGRIAILFVEISVFSSMHDRWNVQTVYTVLDPSSE